MGILSRALWALGASISLSFSWELTLAASENPNPQSGVPTCDSNKNGITVDFPEDGMNFQFKCGPAFKTLVPAELENVYEVQAVTSARISWLIVGAGEEVDLETQGHTKKRLSELYAEATLTEAGESDNKVYTLQIPDTSRIQEKKTLRYFCKKAEEQERNAVENYCLVTINVPPKNSGGEGSDRPEEEQETENVVTCTARSGNPKVTVSNENQTVQLMCDPRDTSTLNPQNLIEVFDNKDGTCAQIAALSELVPEATRSDKDPDNGAYTVTFPKLPSEKQALCYSCSASGHLGLLRTEPCQIHIEVSAATTTTTTMPTTSDAVTRVQAALGQTTAGVLFASIVGVACLA
ncbi:SAG-related sequence SRS37A [Toxoplasma gondii GAB2-2007-GAL-DOM2]|uniref:SAG-related sequence SRS37A n=4 Tax=Toxoplasma gondii TaxID=5811 RepID=S7UPJ0_TOXGG|nr:SAG-related sequence SRS37A [Toxoplasma gondii GT1]KFG29629.1 SAG-related sequence SRS37A [Toxoplasma gondii GAB2-2007-GAL-DOM2]RQX73508.1 SAG-related sequence SRS37A [Toxoplasma gondii CAST]